MVRFEPDPFVVVQMEGLRHMRLVEAPLETSNYCAGSCCIATGNVHDVRDRADVWIVG